MGYVHVKLYYVHTFLNPTINDSTSLEERYKEFLEKYKPVYITDVGGKVYPFVGFANPSDTAEVLDHAKQNRLNMGVYMDISHIIDLYNDLKECDFCNICDILSFKLAGTTSSGINMYEYILDAEAG